jgi:tetratricopeptide (TPR) repeat protein
MPSVKYPLPLAFAYFHAYEKEKYHEKAIDVLKNHLERKNGINQHIIYYNLSCLYRERNDSKKAIFYLETVLKEKPFFEEAIIDYAFLLSMNNRASEAF